MWDIYLDEVKDDDKRISDAWKEYSNSILVFVSSNLLALFVSMTSCETGLVSAEILQLLAPLSLNSIKHCPPV